MQQVIHTIGTCSPAYYTICVKHCIKNVLKIAYYTYKTIIILLSDIQKDNVLNFSGIHWYIIMTFSHFYIYQQ